MANIYQVTPISQQIVGATVKATDIYPATDVTDNTQSPSGTTKKYSIAQLQTYLGVVATGSNKVSCLVATTGNLTASYNNGSDGVGATLTNSGTQAILEIDGVFPAVGQRVLVVSQTTELQNGIYVVTNVGSVSTNWILTRSNDYNGSTTGTIAQGDLIGVTLGNINAETIWFQTAAGPFTVGTTSITFATKNSSAPNLVEVSTSYSASVTDFFIGVTTTSSAWTITLPASTTVSKGKIFVVKDESGAANTNHITVNVAGGANIDGGTTATIMTAYGALQFYNNGTQYYIW